jgi:ketosteroid isomerase-like protein
MDRPLLLIISFCVASFSSLGAQSGPGVGLNGVGIDGLAPLSNGGINALSQPTLTPGVLLLLELEGRFSKSVASGGGRAFGGWFAEDAVTLNNGKPAVLGRTAIAAEAQWDPKEYQLTWTPQGAQMGPSNDMGFTWGQYEGRSKDRHGEPVVTTGRYFTVWKKVPDGSWKVALDASANDAPNAGECCTRQKP